MEIHILKQILKISTVFVFMLQEIKGVAKSKLGLGVQIVAHSMWNQDQKVRLYFRWNQMLSEARLENFWIWIMKNSKIVKK